MQYDPIKKTLGNFFNTSPYLRILFYKLLDLLLLRSWHIHKAFKQWATDKKNKPIQILDAGSGFGQYSFFMIQFSNLWHITAVDVKEEQVADCNTFFKKIHKPQVQFFVDDLTTYTAPDTYDFVLCVDVMEHIENDVQVFKNYNTSLKKGGMLLISTPSDQGGSDVKADGEASFIEEHVRDGYNIEDIKQKIVSAGFSSVEAYYSYGKPGKISWKLSMKYPLQLLNVSKLFLLILPVYYIITFPFSIIFNYLDVHGKHATGTGLIVKAWK